MCMSQHTVEGLRVKSLHHAVAHAIYIHIYTRIIYTHICICV